MKTCVLSLLLTLFSITASAYNFAVNGVYYNVLTTSTCAVTYRTTSYNTYSGNIVIPSEVNYGTRKYTVTAVGDWAFANCSNLTSVTLPATITKLGMCAFTGCPLLQEIALPDNVISIGESAFEECTSLKSINIPSTLTDLGDAAFCKCKSLKTIELPQGITTIGRETFQKCSSLTTMVIPNGVTSIGQAAFEDCSSLLNVSLPESLTSISLYAFWGCSSLQNICLPTKLKIINKYAFCYCTSLTSVIIPASVTTIGDYAFSGCKNLSEFRNYSDTPQTITSNTLPTDLIIYTKPESADAFAEAYIWSNYTLSGTLRPLCAAPIISYNNGTLSFSSTTQKALYHYSLTRTEGHTSSNSVSLVEHLTDTNFLIKVYATAPGYDPSPVSILPVSISESLLRGDMNQDGYITIQDITILADRLLGR